MNYGTAAQYLPGIANQHQRGMSDTSRRNHVTHLFVAIWWQSVPGVAKATRSRLTLFLHPGMDGSWSRARICVCMGRKSHDKKIELANRHKWGHNDPKIKNSKKPKNENRRNVTLICSWSSHYRYECMSCLVLKENILVRVYDYFY